MTATQQPAAAPGAQPVGTASAAGGDGQGGDALDALDAALRDDAGEGQDGGEPQEWTPPTREQWEAQQAALEAERAKLARARKQAQRLREGGAKGAVQPPAPVEGQPEGAPAAADPQLAVWQTRAVRSSAKAQLLERGADPDMVDLALGRLNIAEVSFDADDEPELDEWLDRMEDRYPKLFAKADAGTSTATGTRPVGGVNQGNAAGRPAPRKLSLGEQIIENSRRASQSGRRSG